MPLSGSANRVEHERYEVEKGAGALDGIEDTLPEPMRGNEVPPCIHEGVMPRAAKLAMRSYRVAVPSPQTAAEDAEGVDAVLVVVGSRSQPTTCSQVVVKHTVEVCILLALCT